MLKYKTGYSKTSKKPASKIKKGEFILLGQNEVGKALHDVDASNFLCYLNGQGQHGTTSFIEGSQVQLVRPNESVPAGLIGAPDGNYEAADGTTLDPDYFAYGTNGYCGDFYYGD